MANFIDYFRQGQQDKEYRQERQSQKKFGELVGQSLTAKDRAPIMAQAAQIDPAKTLQFNKYFQDQDAYAAQQKTEQEQRDAQMTLRKLEVLETSRPEMMVQMYRQAAPEDYAQYVQAMGREPTQQEIMEAAQMYKAELYAKTGIAPPQQKRDVREVDGALVDVTNPNGDPRVLYRAPPKEKQANAFVPLTPQEIQAAGLPPGTSAQRDTATGKIDILSKRDNTGALSQKDATTARMKLNTVTLARQQLEKIKTAFGGIKGSVSAGYMGQGYLPTEGGQKFDAAVDQMRSTLTALTRVPGVGAMSDYETKLDQAKFPNRKNYETVTQQQIDGLDDMLALIENGYTGLLEGQQQGPQQQQQQQQQGQPTKTATGPNGEKIGLINGQWVPLNGQ